MVFGATSAMTELLVNLFHLSLTYVGIRPSSVGPSATVPTPTPPALIPRSLLFGAANNSQYMVGLSPDGQFLSHIAPYNGVPNVFVRRLGDKEPFQEAYPATYETGRGIQAYAWTYLPGILIFLMDSGGDENWQLFRLDVVANKSTVLYAEKGVSAEIKALNHFRPDQVLLGLNKRDARFHDLYRCDLRSAELSLVFQNDGFKEIILDNAMEIRLASKETEEGGTEYVQPIRGSDGKIIGWDAYRTVSLVDDFTTKVLAFSADNRDVYWSDCTGEDSEGRPRDLAALVLKDFSDPGGPGHVIHEPKRSDIQGVIFHPTTLRPIAVQENYMKPVYFLVEPGFKDDFHAIFLNNPERSLQVHGISQDLSVWLITYSTDNEPSQYFLYHRMADANRRHFAYLFTVKEEYLNYSLSRVTPVEVHTRDNFTEVCYLGLPKEMDPWGTGVPAVPVPLVVQVHGGPWARDVWGFDAEMQHFTNRGYGVLRCNFRGSTGYGKRFFTASFGEWAGAMHDDILDAVSWAVQQRIAHKDKVAIVGGSYGGYETLVGLSFTPDVFACGVDIVGPSNLLTLLDSIPPYWIPLYNSFVTWIGASPKTAEGLTYLTERSPLFRASRIRRPLLIGQGANDPRVNRHESDQIVGELKANGIPVSYVVFPDEGHGFRRPPNRLAFQALKELFLADCLGGRKEELKGELGESSAVIVEQGSLNLSSPQASTIPPDVDVLPTPQPQRP